MNKEIIGGTTCTPLKPTGGGGSITVDSELSATSTNPVENRVVKTAIDGVLTSVASAQSTANKAQSTADTALNTANSAGQTAYFVKQEWERTMLPKVEGMEKDIAAIETQVGNIDTTATNALEKAEQVEATIDGIDTALERIIAMQNELIGGDGE